jgi:hypothetical protein
MQNLFLQERLEYLLLVLEIMQEHHSQKSGVLKIILHKEWIMV